MDAILSVRFMLYNTVYTIKIGHNVSSLENLRYINSWFVHDVTKIQKYKLYILQSCFMMRGYQCYNPSRKSFRFK